MLGLTVRMIQRWSQQGGGDDRRRGPLAAPANKLTPAERQDVLSVANSPTYRELSPKQIVPRLADEGRYVASESSFYRILRQEANWPIGNAADRPLTAALGRRGPPAPARGGPGTLPI